MVAVVLATMVRRGARVRAVFLVGVVPLVSGIPILGISRAVAKQTLELLLKAGNNLERGPDPFLEHCVRAG
jgi:hypothetical protein